ncbi:MAG: hypothetical protein WB543_10080, partial [Candidatus Acidiferrum sp.]
DGQRVRRSFHLSPESFTHVRRPSANGVFSDWERNLPLRKGQTRSVELRLIYAKEMPKSVPNKKPKA